MWVEPDFQHPKNEISRQFIVHAKKNFSSIKCVWMNKKCISWYIRIDAAKKQSKMSQITASTEINSLFWILFSCHSALSLLLFLSLLNSFCILLHPFVYSTDVCAHCTHGRINKLQCPNNKNEWTLRSRLLYLVLFTLNIIFDCEARLLKHKTSSWLSVRFMHICVHCPYVWMCKRNLYISFASHAWYQYHFSSLFLLLYSLMQLTLSHSKWQNMIVSNLVASASIFCIPNSSSSHPP